MPDLALPSPARDRDVGRLLASAPLARCRLRGLGSGSRRARRAWLRRGAPGGLPAPAFSGSERRVKVHSVAPTATIRRAPLRCALGRRLLSPTSSAAVEMTAASPSGSGPGSRRTRPRLHGSEPRPRITPRGLDPRGSTYWRAKACWTALLYVDICNEWPHPNWAPFFKGRPGGAGGDNWSTEPAMA